MARVRGVVTVTGITFEAPSVVLTVGTFLGGRIHVGLDSYAGRARGRSAVESAGRAATEPAAAGGAPEDRYPAANRRPLGGL